MKHWLIIKPLNATLYSLSGMRVAIATERAFQQELIILFFLFIAVHFSGLSFITSAFLIFSWVMVMVVELLNSAIEAAFDRMGTEENALVKIGKDLASAAVFLLILFNIGLWVAASMATSGI